MALKSPNIKCEVQIFHYEVINRVGFYIATNIEKENEDGGEQGIGSNKDNKEGDKMTTSSRQQPQSVRQS